MQRYRRRRTGFEHLEAALRAERPKPSDELVRRATEIVRGAPATYRLRSLRLALVGVLTVALVAVLSAFGGFTVVASGANAVASTASSARAFVTSGSFSQRNETSRQQQAAQSNRSNNGDGDGDGDGNGNGNGNGDDDDDEDEDDPDDDQYDDRITICHRGDNDERRGNTLRLRSRAALRHLDNHSGDSPGPCPRRRADD